MTLCVDGSTAYGLVFSIEWCIFLCVYRFKDIFYKDITKFIVGEKLRSRDRRQNNLLHRSLKCNHYCEFLKLNWITLIYSWILGVACIPPTPISEIILLIQNNLMLFCSSPIYWIYLENILFHKRQSYIYL